MKKRLIQIALVVLIFISAYPLSILAEDIQATEADINIETIPANPEPNSDVTVTLSSYATDLNKALITWKSGNQTLLSGTGRVKYSFKAGGANTSTAFEVTVVPAGSFLPITKTFTINPSEVEILWQAVDSYTPPFYKGRSFPTSEGTIKVVAIPNTVGIGNGDSKSMSYTWKLDYNTVADASGYGKNSFIFRNSYLRDIEHVGVFVSSANNLYTGENVVDIPINSPEVIFYKKSPTEGILYNRSLSSEEYLTEDEMTLVVEPYFLNLKNDTENFVYKWSINGQNIDTPRNPRQLTVRPESRGGYATISIDISSVDKLFQSVVKSIRVNL